MPVKQRNAAKPEARSASSQRRSLASTASQQKSRKIPDIIDVYIRMNESPNSDYCFSVPSKEPVSWLLQIFDTVPVLLTPSYFFEFKPKGFAASIHPGYMTAEGGILFSDVAHLPEWTKEAPLDAKIGDVFTEGQLIAPIWQRNTKREYSVIAFLLFWLYLDLPEFISPTPGTAPSNILSWIADQFVSVPEEPQQSIFQDTRWQLAFFAFHVLKVGLIYLILWNGFWNPASRSRKVKMPTDEDMTRIGWTGTRRCAWLEWSERYLNVRTERAGGVLEAYRKGLLAQPIGMHLRDGEGWNVLKDKTLNEVKVQEDLLDDDGNFVVSIPYFFELTKPLARYLKDPEVTEDEKAKAIKEYREVGGYAGTDFMREFFSDMVAHDEHEYQGIHVEQMGKSR